jgi:hypothetical protein
MDPASMITVVRGNAAELTELLEYLRPKVRPNSRIFVCVSEAVEEASVKGIGEVDETTFKRVDVMTLFEAWAELGHGRFVAFWPPKKKLKVRAK